MTVLAGADFLHRCFLRLFTDFNFKISIVFAEALCYNYNAK